ncbi:hypothetical protein CEXT_44991 [Caerostris extrusa]|uniref:Uncharacterized protein n=1 Tax=Caerostris extrusa TaxID=172846 RepID=A0AAV4USK1_CAEEX|nr:hypothetical protein CEXT_44991 [Caerostris extrusa]
MLTDFVFKGNETSESGDVARPTNDSRGKLGNHVGGNEHGKGWAPKSILHKIKTPSTVAMKNRNSFFVEKIVCKEQKIIELLTIRTTFQGRFTKDYSRD